MGSTWEKVMCTNCQGAGVLFVNESEIPCGRCGGDGELMERKRIEGPEAWYLERD